MFSRRASIEKVRTLAEELGWPGLSFKSYHERLAPSDPAVVKTLGITTDHSIPGGQQAWEGWFADVGTWPVDSPERRAFLSAAHEALLQRQKWDAALSTVPPPVTSSPAVDPRVAARIEKLLTKLRSGKQGVLGVDHLWGRLREQGDPGLDAMISLLTEERPGLRASAARALGESRDPRALEPLLDLLQEEATLDRKGALSEMVMNSAIFAIRRLSDPRVGQTLDQIDQDESLTSRHKAARVLALYDTLRR